MFFGKVRRFEAAEAHYAEEWNNYFSLVSKRQMEDRELWRLLIRQLVEKTDDGDDGWRGEYWGKLMRGGALIYAYTKKEALYQALTASVEELLTVQEETGRFSSYSVEKEFHGWDMWARKYIMLGLEYFYEVCRDDELKKQIVCALEKHANYITARVGEGEGKIRVQDTSTAWGAINSLSIIQPFVKLYKLTEKKEYLDYAKELISIGKRENGIFSLAKADEKCPFEYPITKAYEIISCFEGLLELYEVDGKEERLQICAAFADRVLKTDFVLTGASGGRDEYFNNSTKKQVEYTKLHKYETCVTVTLMKFFSSLYRATGEKKYLDAIERSFYNAYLGALNWENNRGYKAVPLFYSYSPLFDNERWTLVGGEKNISPYATFGCCIAIGAAGLGILPTVGVAKTAEGVAIGLFIGGEYSVDGVKLRLETDYPYDGKIVVTILEAEQPVRLKLRIPDWCDRFSMDGEYAVEQGFVCLKAALGAGERVEYTMETPYKVIPSTSVNEGVSNLFAVTRGPLVLCADSCETDVFKAYVLEEKDGYAVGEGLDGKYRLRLKNGDGLILREYRFAGKDYYAPREISVWLKKA